MKPCHEMGILFGACCEEIQGLSTVGANSQYGVTGFDALIVG